MNTTLSVCRRSLPAARARRCYSDQVCTERWRAARAHHGRRAVTNQLTYRECEARPVHGVQDLVDSGLSSQIRPPIGGDEAAKSQLLYKQQRREHVKRYMTNPPEFFVLLRSPVLLKNHP
jgi:hypothetical protein